MTPIEGVSDIRRMPRLGKIRLGIKVEPEGKNPYPRATDYFVVPDEIKAYTGDMPKLLSIMFPTEKVDEFAQQWLRCYSFTQGLTCKGDGRTAIRKIDVDTGDIARHTTAEWVFKDWGCDPDTCEQYSEKQCRRVMNLLFFIPDVPGVGVWQLDTTSFYSIVNINSCVDLIRRLCGRIAFIPLNLSLEPLEVSPAGIKKKTVHILAIRSDVKLADIQKLGRVPPEKIMLPLLEEEEAPEDLYPQQKLVEAEPKAAEERAPAEPREEKAPDDVTEDDVPDMNAVVRVCFHFWQMQPVEVCGQLGYKTMIDLKASGISPWEAWLTIKQLKQPQKQAEEPAKQAFTPPSEPTKIKPKQAQWRAFWEHADQLGLSRDRVCEMLEATSVKEWTDQGKTLDEAIEVVSKKLIKPGTETEEVTGEGFNIDMHWLNEALGKLKWNEATVWSFVVSQYKVDGSGTFAQTLGRLTREQAEDFINQINKRLEKQKPLF